MKNTLPELKTRLELKRDERFMISILTNSVCYFMETVLIAMEDGEYRLLAIHQGKLYTDHKYKTARGARIAFLKLWGYRAWQEDIQAIWSHFYPPDKGWYDQKITPSHPQPDH